MTNIDSVGGPSIEEQDKEPKKKQCPAKVEFKEHGTKYGWDDYTKKTVPWKSVEKGQNDTVKAIIKPKGKATNAEFESSDSNKVNISPSTASSASQVLDVKGVGKGDVEIKATCDGNTLDKFKAKTYIKKTKTVAIRLVHEKNYTSTDVSDADIKAYLNTKVYCQAVFEFKITRLPAKTVKFDKNGDGKIDVDSWNSDEMKIIINECKDDSYDCNIFLVNNPSDRSLGFMDPNQKYGFVHADKSSYPTNTIAHEVRTWCFWITTPGSGDSSRQ